MLLPLLCLSGGKKETPKKKGRGQRLTLIRWWTASGGSRVSVSPKIVFSEYFARVYQALAWWRYQPGSGGVVVGCCCCCWLIITSVAVHSLSIRGSMRTIRRRRVPIRLGLELGKNLTIQ